MTLFKRDLDAKVQVDIALEPRVLYFIHYDGHLVATVFEDNGEVTIRYWSGKTKIEM